MGQLSFIAGTKIFQLKSSIKCDSTAPRGKSAPVVSENKTRTIPHSTNTSISMYSIEIYSNKTYRSSIRPNGCADWSTNLNFENGISSFSYDKVHYKAFKIDAILNGPCREKTCLRGFPTKRVSNQSP